MNLFKRIKALVSGRKTYLAGLAGTALVVAAIAGVSVPVWAYVLVVSIGGASARSAIDKAQKAAEAATEAAQWSDTKMKGIASRAARAILKETY